MRNVHLKVLLRTSGKCMNLSDQESLHQQVVELLLLFKDKHPFLLVKASGTKYSIIEDLVLWLTTKNDNRFGQVIRSKESLKMRRIAIRDLKPTHLEVMRELLSNQELDPNEYQMIYGRNQLYLIKDEGDKSARVDPSLTLNPTKTNRRELDDFSTQRGQSKLFSVLEVPKVKVCFIQGSVGFVTNEEIVKICEQEGLKIEGEIDQFIEHLVRKHKQKLE